MKTHLVRWEKQYDGFHYSITIYQPSWWKKLWMIPEEMTLTGNGTVWYHLRNFKRASSSLESIMSSFYNTIRHAETNR